jgi:hypothetical protein
VFFNRRSFLKGSAALTAGFSALVGALELPVSTLTWMREANGVITATKDLTTADLDYLMDRNANTIGALMLHLAATETYYQLNTFENKKWDTWPDSREAAVGCGDESGGRGAGKPSRATIETTT